VLLHARIDGRVRAHRAADAADARILGGRLQARDRAIQLRDPACDLETERDRFGDDAVRAAGHQRPAVLDGQVGRGLADGGEIVHDLPRRFHHLHRHGGVIQVLARHPEVDVPRLGLSDGLVEDGQKCDDVVADS